LFTNGLTMTRELAQALGGLAVQAVEISIYSTRAEMHDFVTGVKGSFARSTAGVRHLVEAGVAVTIKTPVMSLNEDETIAYAALADRLGAAYCFSPDELMPREGGDRAPEAFTLSDAARIQISQQLAEVKPECSVPDGESVDPHARPLDGIPCGAGRVLHVEPNGELRPCTMLELDLGHALHDGIAAAHRGNDAAKSLRELTWAELHGCRQCDLRAHCQRCYAAALAQVGDALAPYETACRTARSNYELNTGHAPLFSGERDRNVMLGPYRMIAAGVFEPFDHIITPDDDALARRLGWVRRSSGGQAAPGVAARPGELIQIRRPGRTKPKLERIPVGTSASSTVEVARGTTETERRT
jgi:radical SAM protein with 4Fe4S-binding SPASM domain